MRRSGFNLLIKHDSLIFPHDGISYFFFHLVPIFCVRLSIQRGYISCYIRTINIHPQRYGIDERTITEKQFSGLTSLTLFYDNNVISKMRIRYPHDARPNVKWISDEKARELASLRTDPMTDLIVHCELCLGMRRVEVLRLTPESFLGDRVRIQGKGPVGGKTRFMPYHPSTSDILATYNNHRRSVIDQAKGRSHFVEVPSDLLIYYRYGRLRAYDKVKATAINNRVAAVGKKVGIENLANHMMRRTFGRTMWRDGVKIETISAMLGHDSIEQTLEYIGANIDDMQSAMQIFSLR